MAAAAAPATATPPTVQSLGDIISSLTAANQPNFDNLNQQATDINNENTSDQAALQGQQTAAFGKITNQANARGATFSGFTPNQEATYTSSTYLPALAKLQQTIASARTALAGNQAKLVSGIDTQANSEETSQQNALAAWEDAQIKAQQAQDTLNQQEAFTANEDSLNRAATAANTRATAAASASKSAASTANTNYNAAMALEKNLGTDVANVIKGNSVNGVANSGVNREQLIKQVASKYYGARDANGNPISNDAMNQAVADQIYGGLRFQGEPAYQGLPSDWTLQTP